MCKWIVASLDIRVMGVVSLTTLWRRRKGPWRVLVLGCDDLSSDYSPSAFSPFER